MWPGGFSANRSDRTGFSVAAGKEGRPSPRLRRPRLRRPRVRRGLGDMAVNMSKNGAELMAAYKDVVDGRSDTDWVLFTYEGNSNAIRVAGKGGGGLEEMVEELNSGKVMYAFCRVQEPNSGLPKYVLVNWTGEGVKETHKGLCANHLSTVANFLKGAHVTINARDEDDVDPDVILSKVSKASGANSNRPESASPRAADVPRGAAASVYRRTNAAEEIRQIDKDSFWTREQREEEARRQAEANKAELQRRTVEKERRDLDQKHAEEREKKIQQRSVAIDHNRIVQKQREEEEREKEQQRRNVEDEAKTSTGLKLPASVQAAHEAKALIAQRSFNPHDVFKRKDTSSELGSGGAAPTVGKLRSPFLSQQAFDSPQPPTGHKASRPSEPAPATSPTREPFQAFEFAGGHEPSVAQSAPHSRTAPSSPPGVTTSTDGFLSRAAATAMAAGGAAAGRAAAEEDDWSDEFDDDLYEAAPGGERLKTLTDAMFPTHAGDNECAVPRPAGGAVFFDDVGRDANTAQDDDDDDDAGQNVRARAVYDYQAADDTEITFDPNDIITGIEMVDEGWWRGYGPDGHYGMFPANYVELL
ncbi:drebrin-like protein B isoform X3 [Phycodurus eques]|uniref:drebrin-like protein B isoform X3 n=1 Tax=Phycodurus eques TaxID=693459 RepID=UPI002ACEE65E|nr:drebrin-like protein B isoform X3 [Phycodurus eques]